MKKNVLFVAITIVACVSYSAFASCIQPPTPATPDVFSATGTVAGFYASTADNSEYCYVIMQNIQWQYGSGVTVGGSTLQCGYFAFKSTDKHVLAVLMDAKNNITPMLIRCSSVLTDGTLLIAYVTPQ